MNNKTNKPTNCGECNFSEEQRTLHGESRYECVTCVELNCGTSRFEINKRCPLNSK